MTLWDRLRKAVKTLLKQILFYVRRSRGHNLGIPHYIELEGEESSFGYHDLSSVSPDGGLIASLTRRSDYSELRVLDLSSTKVLNIAKTRCFASQIGARIHWLSNQKLFFLSLSDSNNKAVGVIWDIVTGLQTYTLPFYSVCWASRLGCILDLSFINSVRPGYGFSNQIDPTIVNKVLAFDDDSQPRVILDLAAVVGLTSNEYINHVSFNSKGNFISLLVIGSGCQYRSSRLIVVSIEERKIVFTSPSGLVCSHKIWIDNYQLAFTGYQTKDSAWYLVSADLNQPDRSVSRRLTSDFHPWAVGNKNHILIGDRYPDRVGRRKIIVFDLNSGQEFDPNVFAYDHFLNVGGRKIDIHIRSTPDKKFWYGDILSDSKRTAAIFSIPEKIRAAIF